jgi:hypothetical protein
MRLASGHAFGALRDFKARSLEIGQSLQSVIQ